MSKESLTLEDAKRLLQIDKHNLDEEFRGQAELYDQIGTVHVRAINFRDYAKDVLADAEATVYKRFKGKTDKSRTEAELKSEVQQSDLRKRKFEEYLEARLEADLWGVKKEAFQQRAKMLEYLAKLYLVGYFGDRVIKEPSPEEKEVVTSKVKDRMRERRKGSLALLRKRQRDN